MNAVFEELKKLPCHYCIYYGNYNSKCLSRSTKKPSNGLHDECDMMELDIDIVMDGIIHYFEFDKANK